MEYDSKTGKEIGPLSVYGQKVEIKWVLEKIYFEDDIIRITQHKIISILKEPNVKEKHVISVDHIENYITNIHSDLKTKPQKFASFVQTCLPALISAVKSPNAQLNISTPSSPPSTTKTVKPPNAPSKPKRVRQDEEPTTSTSTSTPVETKRKTEKTQVQNEDDDVYIALCIIPEDQESMAIMYVNESTLFADITRDQWNAYLQLKEKKGEKISKMLEEFMENADDEYVKVITMNDDLFVNQPKKTNMIVSSTHFIKLF